MTKPALLYKLCVCSLLFILLLSCQKELPENTALPPPDNNGNTDTTGNGNGNNNDDSTDDGDNVYYYLRFTVNDIEKEYRAYTKVSFPEYVLEGIRLYACQIEAQQDLNGTINTLHITLNDSFPIVQGKEYHDDAFSVPYGAIINYNDGSNNIFSSADAVPDSKVKVFLSAITPTYVSGTFFGKVGNVIDSSYDIYPDSAVITNGSFKVRRD